MSFLIFIVSIAALIVALKVLRDSRPRPGQPTSAERIASLEERVRDLLYRVWTLEQQAGTQQAGGPPSAVTPAPEALHEPEVAAPTVAPLIAEAEPAPSPACRNTKTASVLSPNLIARYRSMMPLA